MEPGRDANPPGGKNATNYAALRTPGQGSRQAGIFIKFSCHRTIAGNRSSGRWASAAVVVQDLGKMFEEDSRVVDFGAARLAHAEC
jgi:hypothetical protein